MIIKFEINVFPKRNRSKVSVLLIFRFGILGISSVPRIVYASKLWWNIDEVGPERLWRPFWPRIPLQWKEAPHFHE